LPPQTLQTGGWLFTETWLVGKGWLATKVAGTGTKAAEVAWAGGNAATSRVPQKVQNKEPSATGMCPWGQASGGAVVVAIGYPFPVAENETQ
jgi:hypothetical protein